MFRIHFDTSTSTFVVQVLRYGTVWRTAQSHNAQQKFKTYTEARAWVESIGLHDLYDEQHPKSYKHFIMNGGVR